MDPLEVVKFYGSAQRVASALGVTRQAVSKWVRAGRIPPLRVYEIEERTRGALIRRKGRR